MNNSGYASIEINGETVGIKFGMPANRMIMEKVVEDPSIMSGESFNDVGIAFLLFAGYTNNCLAKDVVPTKTFGYFMEYVEECEVDDTKAKELKDIAGVYAQSRFTKKYIENLNTATEEIKKKMNTPTGISSNPSVMESSDLSRQSTLV